LAKYGNRGKNFWCYFEKNWLCKDWCDAWTDISRKKWQADGLKKREGLWNTNNITESLIKQIGNMFAGKKMVLVSTLFSRIGKIAFTHFAYTGLNFLFSIFHYSCSTVMEEANKRAQTRCYLANPTGTSFNYYYYLLSYESTGNWHFTK